MTKFKDFYDSSHGLIYNINAVNPIQSTWVSECDISALDNYLLLHIGNREVLPVLEDADNFAKAVMGDILKAYNFKLDGLWRTTQLDDEYNPLDNKDRTFTRTETIINSYGDVNNTVNNGQRKQTNVIAQRNNSESLGSRSDSSSESLGARTDSHTSSGQTTAFDTTDYNKGTNKVTDSDTVGAQSNTGSSTIGAQSNSSTLGGGTDTFTNDASQDTSKVTRGNDNSTITVTENEHGNIGVTTSGELLEDYRKSHNFVFFDYVQEIILHEFAKSFLWE